MISVQFLNDKENNAYRILMEGHAGYDEKGKDIICAGASTLCLTMAKCLEKNAKCLSSEPKIEINDGYADIQWSIQDKHIAPMHITLDAIITGFQVLTEMYPDYIEMK